MSSFGGGFSPVRFGSKVMMAGVSEKTYIPSSSESSILDDVVEISVVLLFVDLCHPCTLLASALSTVPKSPADDRHCDFGQEPPAVFTQPWMHD